MAKINNCIWEIVLWDLGEDRVLGRFYTREEAREALREIKKWYLNPDMLDDKHMLDKIHDGIAAYSIEKIAIDGLNPEVEFYINFNKELYAQKKEEK